MNDRRLEILKMVESGKITAEDGANLLRAIDPPNAGRRGVKAAVICIKDGSDIKEDLCRIITGCCGEEAMKVIQCCDTDKSVDVDCCCEPEDKE